MVYDVQYITFSLSVFSFVLVFRNPSEVLTVIKTAAPEFRENWQYPDIVMVSDGDFYPESELLDLSFRF